MKLNLRIGAAIDLVKSEYEKEYQEAIHADEVGRYLHALCTFYSELVGKNVSLLNPIAFACKYYRMFLQNELVYTVLPGDKLLTSIYLHLNELVLKEFQQSKMRQKEKKVSQWINWSSAYLQEYSRIGA